MAIIILKPGESFEHYHEGPSLSQHISGNLTLRIADETFKFTNFTEFKIPPNTSHTVTNIGIVEAKFSCEHSLEQEQVEHD